MLEDRPRRYVHRGSGKRSGSHGRRPGPGCRFREKLVPARAQVDSCPLFSLPGVKLRSGCARLL